jgi:uncharacterized protein YkwD
MIKLMQNRVLFHGLLILSLMTAVGCSSRDFDPGWDLENVSLSSEEQNALDQINQLRSKNGLSALQVDSSLQAAARHHSAFMLYYKALEHEESGANELFYNRIQRAGGRFSTSLENIECGSPDATATILSWSQSPDHRQAMLDPAVQSIGIAREGDGHSLPGECPYAYFWTADFGGN